EGEPVSEGRTGSGAQEIKGRVVEVTGDSVKVRTDSNVQPARGDKVAFSFAIPGLDEVAAAGSGTVTGVEDGLVIVRIQGTKRTAKGYLAAVRTSQPARNPVANQPRRRSRPVIEEGEPDQPVVRRRPNVSEGEPTSGGDTAFIEEPIGTKASDRPLERNL